MSRNGLISFGTVIVLIIGVAVTTQYNQPLQKQKTTSAPVEAAAAPSTFLPSPIATAEAANETPEHKYVQCLTDFANRYAAYEEAQARAIDTFNLNCIPLMFKIGDADEALTDAEAELKTFEEFSRNAGEELKPVLQNITTQLGASTEQLRLIRSLAKQSRTPTTPVTLPGRPIDDGRDTH